MRMREMIQTRNQTRQNWWISFRTPSHVIPLCELEPSQLKHEPKLTPVVQWKWNVHSKLIAYRLPPKKKTRLWTERRHKLHLGGLGVGSDGAKVLELSRPGEGRGLFHATLI